MLQIKQKGSFNQKKKQASDVESEYELLFTIHPWHLEQCWHTVNDP